MFFSWLDWGGGFGVQGRRGDAPSSPWCLRHPYRSRPIPVGVGLGRLAAVVRVSVPTAKSPSPSPRSIQSPRSLLPLQTPRPPRGAWCNEHFRCSAVPSSPETSPGPKHYGESKLHLSSLKIFDMNFISNLAEKIDPEPMIRGERRENEEP